MEHKFGNLEADDGDVTADAWITAIIRVSCIMVVGLIIISGICTASNTTASSPLYSIYNSLLNQFNGGYSLAALMILVISAVALIYFLCLMWKLQ
jgi:hypothetical protein